MELLWSKVFIQMNQQQHSSAFFSLMEEYAVPLLETTFLYLLGISANIWFFTKFWIKEASNSFLQDLIESLQ